MLIVIDLSKKLDGYKLYENFLYKLEKEENIFIANNPLTGDKLDYDELKLKVQNVLYNNHANSFSLCILYDKSEQKIDPLINSMVNNVNKIFNKIINSLSFKYNFNKLYYVSLDDVVRDIDSVAIDKNVKLATDFDSLGYIQEEYDSEYTDILFTLRELEQIDDKWDNIKNNNSSLNEMFSELESELNSIFSNKIDVINNKYLVLSWYSDSLLEVYRVVLEDFKTALYKNANDINNIEKISMFIKYNLKNKVSSYKNRDISFINVNLNSSNGLNSSIFKYRQQIGTLAYIIYLAKNDTKFIFGENKYLGKENHWKLNNIELDDVDLSKMLNSYNYKLNVELEKIEKIQCNKVKYEEYQERKLDFSLENEMDKLPKFFGVGLFHNKKDVNNIVTYLNKLYERYVKGIKYAEKKLCKLTMKLRLNRNAGCTDKIEIVGDISDLSLIINEKTKRINELEQIVSAKQFKGVVDDSNNLKFEYEKYRVQIGELMNKRISFKRFVINEILIIITSLLSYMIVSKLVLPGNLTFILSNIMLVLPTGLYSVIQIIYLLSIRIKIVNKILRIRNNNEVSVSKLYSNDSEMDEFIKNTCELMSLKKYRDECNLIIKRAMNECRKREEHINKLKEHIANNKKLMSLLGIEDNVDDIIYFDNKSMDLDINKNVDLNKIYCPLNYCEDKDDNKVIISGDLNVEINSNLIGFVKSFNMSYDKEYCHE